MMKEKESKGHKRKRTYTEIFIPLSFLRGICTRIFCTKSEKHNKITKNPLPIPIISTSPTPIYPPTAPPSPNQSYTCKNKGKRMLSQFSLKYAPLLTCSSCALTSPRTALSAPSPSPRRTPPSPPATAYIRPSVSGARHLPLIPDRTSQIGDCSKEWPLWWWKSQNIKRKFESIAKTEKWDLYVYLSLRSNSTLSKP